LRCAQGRFPPRGLGRWRPPPHCAARKDDFLVVLWGAGGFERCAAREDDFLFAL
jgi:hypothetical protein